MPSSSTADSTAEQPLDTVSAYLSSSQSSLSRAVSMEELSRRWLGESSSSSSSGVSSRASSSNGHRSTFAASTAVSTAVAADADKLISACKNNDLQAVNDLMVLLGQQHRQQVLHRFDKLGYCALHYAVSNGHVRMVKKLISCGADVNIGTLTYGLTPLHMIVAADESFDTLSLCLALRRLQADVHRQSASGVTPMQLALPLTRCFLSMEIDRAERLLKLLLQSSHHGAAFETTAAETASSTLKPLVRLEHIEHTVEHLVPELRREIAEGKARTSSLESELEVAREALRRQQQDAQSAQLQHEKALAEVIAASESSHREQLNRLQDELLRIRSESEERRIAYDTLRGTLESLQQASAASDIRKAELEASIAQLQQQNREYELSNALLKLDKQHLTETINRTHLAHGEERQQLLARLEQLARQLQAVETERSQLQSKIQSIQTEMHQSRQDLQGQVDRMELQLQAVQEEKNAAQHEVEELRSLLAERPSPPSSASSVGSSIAPFRRAVVDGLQDLKREHGDLREQVRQGLGSALQLDLSDIVRTAASRFWQQQQYNHSNHLQHVKTELTEQSHQHIAATTAAAAVEIASLNQQLAQLSYEAAVVANQPERIAMSSSVQNTPRSARSQQSVVDLHSFRSMLSSMPVAGAAGAPSFTSLTPRHMRRTSPTLSAMSISTHQSLPATPRRRLEFGGMLTPRVSVPRLDLSAAATAAAAAAAAMQTISTNRSATAEDENDDTLSFDSEF